MPPETMDDLVEWLADQATVSGPRDDVPDGSGHADTCRCRLCWTMDVKRRLRAVVTLERQRALAHATLGPPPGHGDDPWQPQRRPL